MFTLEDWKREEVRNAKFDWEWRGALTACRSTDTLGRVENLRTTLIGRCFGVTEEEAEKEARTRCFGRLTNATAVVTPAGPGPMGVLIDEDLSGLEWQVEEVSVHPLDPLVLRLEAFRNHVNLELQLPLGAFGPAGTDKQRRLWDHLCGFMDVMDDAATGIVGFLLDGVDGSGRYGEAFLRLSGVLACACNQQESIMSLYREFGEDFIKDRRDTLDLKAWAPLWELRNQIACHSLGRQFIATHVPSWTEGHYMGFRRVNRATSEHEYREKINLARLLRDWQQDVIVILDDLQPRLERALCGDEAPTPPRYKGWRVVR